MFPKSSTSGDVVVFNVLTLSIINVIHAHITPIAAIAVSPCGNLLATASDAVRVPYPAPPPGGLDVLAELKPFTTSASETIIATRILHTP